MFAIKRVFAAPPGKTSGFADLFQCGAGPAEAALFYLEQVRYLHCFFSTKSKFS
jgi:hypothetical protein